MAQRAQHAVRVGVLLHMGRHARVAGGAGTERVRQSELHRSPSVCSLPLRAHPEQVARLLACLPLGQGLFEFPYDALHKLLQGLERDPVPLCRAAWHI